MAPDFDYLIVRSRRKTLCISVDAGSVTVRAPKRFPEHRIREFLDEKSEWVLRKLAESRQRAVESPRHTFSQGEVFLFQGDILHLDIKPSSRNRIMVKGQCLIVELAFGRKPEDLPGMLRRWYSRRARAAFLERLAFYSNELGIPPPRVSVRDQRRRWGSCSSSGTVSLNWKLVMAPPGILDYVVAHELCHMLHPNHGREFWAALTELMPDCRDRRKWLRDNGHKLGL